MATYIYEARRHGRISPYLISLWSGYHAAALTLSAFVLLNLWSDNPTGTFGGLIFACMIGGALGGRFGQMLARRPPYMMRLILLLILAAILSGITAIYGEGLAGFMLQGDESSSLATLPVTGLLFVPPLLLLAALPSYATAVLRRRRGSAGSANGAISLFTWTGYGLGIIVTSRCFAHGLEPWTMLKSLGIIALILALAVLPRHLPRRARGR
ncbi:MAG TPA: hypothetical protein VNS79_03940 [Sphingobium sp.]|nr:hypothetical protein [Sphingobium sp.]